MLNHKKIRESQMAFADFISYFIPYFRPSFVFTCAVTSVLSVVLT